MELTPKKAISFKSNEPRRPMVRGVFCSSQQLKAFVANTELIFALVMYVCSSWGISPKYVNPHKAVD